VTSGDWEKSSRYREKGPQILGLALMSPFGTNPFWGTGFLLPETTA
jgi:hypothetical protein